MKPNIQTAYNRIQDVIASEGEKLSGQDWYDLLEEVSSHVECLLDCYKEENPEDFE